MFKEVNPVVFTTAVYAEVAFAALVNGVIVNAITFPIVTVATSPAVSPSALAIKL